MIECLLHAAVTLSEVEGKGLTIEFKSELAPISVREMRTRRARTAEAWRDAAAPFQWQSRPTLREAVYIFCVAITHIYGRFRSLVKTTIEIPNELFRKWKASAAAQGQSMKEFLTHALQDKLTGRKQRNGQTTGWRTVWGKAKVRQLREVDAIIHSEFERIEAESWR
jgi:hypothetical protein